MLYQITTLPHMSDDEYAASVLPPTEEVPPRVRLVCITQGSKLRVQIRGAGYPAHVNSHVIYDSQMLRT